MKTIELSIKKISLLLIVIILTSASVFGATFTAVTSGNWSSTVTWGGAAPPTNVSTDMVVIPVGTNVTMDNNVSVIGALGYIHVDGTLTSAPNVSLTVSGLGNLSGSGSVNINEMVLNTGANLTFTGSIVANIVTTSALSVQIATSMVINQVLNLSSGTFIVVGGGNLVMGNNCTIVVSGGAISVGGGGSLWLNSIYNVTYTSVSSATGIELTGSGLNNVAIDVSSGNTITLTSDLFIDGTLSLTSGTLELNGSDLTITGDVSTSGSGTISSTIVGSDININATGGITSSLNFTGGTNMVNNFSVSVGAGNQVQVGGTIAVGGALQLTSGTLNFSGADFTINGSLSGTGSFGANTSSNFTINTSGGLPGVINFIGGAQTLNNLTINVGAGNSATLGTNLSVAGILSLSGGSNLDISGVLVSIGGDITGSGSLIVTPTSELAINAANSITSGISFIGSSIGNITINAGSGNTVTLGSNLIVSGVLTLQSGTLILNSNSLTVLTSGDVSASGSGTISATVPSNITISASGGISGSLNFSGSSSVSNFTINVGLGNPVQIGGSLSINGTLDLATGILNFSGGNLTINGSMTGSGLFSASTVSNITINTSGGLSSAISFTSGGQAVNNFTANVGSGNSVALGSALTVAGDVNLMGGSSFNFNGQMLTIGGSVTGSGLFTADTSSGLIVTGSGGISTPIIILGGTIGSLEVNVGSGNTIILGGDLTVTGMLSLQSGTLMLNGYDLTISGNVAASGSGSISSTTGSNISVITSGGVIGTLNFNGGGGTVNNFTINVGTGSQVQIGGSLAVNGTLAMTSGTLNFSGADLTINGDVNGTGLLSGNTYSNIVINTSGGISGGISFANGGQVVNNFTINAGSGNSVALGSGVTVGGTLDLTGGSILNFSGQSLTVGGNISGSGSFTANTGSSLIINTGGTISTPITISGGALGILVINAGNGNSVTLGGDLSISGTLNLQSGTLILNSYNLTISGNIAAGGSGTISSTSSSDITISSIISPAGSIGFDANGNAVNNFTVNIGGSGGSVMLGSDLTVTGNLNFMSGSVNVGSFGLDIGASGSISGAGNTSYVITGINGRLGMQLTAGAGASTMFPVGTSMHFSPANIQLNAGSTSGGVDIGVLGNVYASGTTGADISANQPLVDATWHVTSDISSNLNMNMEVMWSTAMEVNAFNRTSAYISHYTGGSWDAVATTTATAEGGGTFSLQRNNITSLSPFAVFDESTATTVPEVSKPELKFEVYPNPASSYIIVQNLLASTEMINVDVTNVIGQVVASYKLTDTTLDIPLTALFSGNYFIRLYNDKINTVKKFTKM